MNNTKRIIEVEIKNERFEYTLWFIFLLSGIGLVFGSAFAIANSDTLENGFIILITLGSILVLVGLFLSNEKKNIIVDKYYLILNKSIFGIQFNKKYELKKISNIHLEKNVKSNIYTSSKKYSFGDYEYIPESSKKYYYHKNILSFHYNNEVIEIGKWKKNFDANLVLNTINELKTVN
ncbi:hypothetical protein ACFO3U_10095 [Flavobacterium ponti]|uniref:Uncharacterized protein n=1 Tax=Flavobacterium ponti TaxID=665133 RepID=A0ABV9P3Y5_9FLAO